MTRRRIPSALLFLFAGCTVGGSNAVLPGGGAVVDSGDGGGRDGADGTDAPRDGDAQGDGAQGDGAQGDGDDTPRQDAGTGDGADAPDDASVIVVPQGCTAQSYGSHQYLFCTTSVWWDAARAACQGAGVDLVVIESQDENEFVKSHIQGESWIGLNDIDTEGTLVWIEPGAPGVSGGAVTYETWYFTNPDDCVGLGDQDCVHMRPDGLWDDMACNESQGCPLVTGTRQYVCESY